MPAPGAESSKNEGPMMTPAWRAARFTRCHMVSELRGRVDRINTVPTTFERSDEIASKWRPGVKAPGGPLLRSFRDPGSGIVIAVCSNVDSIGGHRFGKLVHNRPTSTVCCHRTPPCAMISSCGCHQICGAIWTLIEGFLQTAEVPNFSKFGDGRLLPEGTSRLSASSASPTAMWLEILEIS